MQVYRDIEGISLPLLRNNQFSLKVIMAVGPSVDELK